MEFKLTNSQFLLATPELNDSFFEKSIVLVLSHNDEDGAYGLILNRISHMPLNEVFSGIPPKARTTFPFFIGGPVEENKVQLLQTQRLQMDKDQIADESAGLDSDDPEKLLEYIYQDDIRVFLGYSGWAPNQLETEIENELWEVHSTNVGDVLNLGEDLGKLSPADFKKQFISSTEP